MRSGKAMLPLLLLFVLAPLAACFAGETPKVDAIPPVTAQPQPAEDGPIQDNSFLVEEAYNQEDGVIQHISFVQLLNNHDWVYTQTDEWPLRSLKHQLSLTVAFNESGSYAPLGPGWGDTAINYRYQLIGSGETRLAVAPRISLVLPTGATNAGRGFGGWGMQTNLPISIQHNRHLVTHWNIGATWIPSAQDAAHDHASVVNPNLGQSTVWLVKPRFNVLCETVWTSNATVTGSGQTTRQQSIYVSPGIRWAYNFKSGLQIVPGVAMPIGVGPTAGQNGAIFYLSFEHPFGFARSRK